MPDPILLVADKNQNIFDMPGLLACGQSGGEVGPLSTADLIPLPKGSNMFFLPDRDPVAFNISSRKYESVEGYFSVAAFIPPGYTHLQTTAYQERRGAKLLPLFSYTPVALYKEAFYVPAVRVDLRKNHDISALNKPLLERRIQVFRHIKNRLIRHLEDCALINSCPNAINFFLGKYECPLPTSPSCNASCLGCISSQPKDSCPASQPRLTFVPTAGEVAEVALLHIKAAKDPVVSFGQGCEGEPLLSAKVIGEAIGIIRRQTTRGTIHMNSNASLTDEIELLCKAGLDSLRVSLNSVRKEYYQRYYAPRGYDFSDVGNSITIALRHKKFVALNYLVMPGFTDSQDEYCELRRFLRKKSVNMIQWRNLNYDPQRYFSQMKAGHNVKLLGLRSVMRGVSTEFPGIRQGYFNVPKEKFRVSE